MSDWMIAIVAVSSVLVYGLLAGVTMQWAALRWGADSDVVPPAGLFWPIVLPGMIGAALVRRAFAPKLPRATARSKP